jgi:hypothetical protein
MKKQQPDPKKKAKQLMKKSDALKWTAAQQESLGKGQIKNKVKEGSMQYMGNTLPVGKQRLEIAKKMRAEASSDSLKAVKMYPSITPKKK